MTLVVVGIVVMFTTALVATNRNMFGFTKRSQDQAQALALGQGGLNRLIHRLTYDENFSADLTFGDSQTGYNITFDTADPNRSVNNLMNDAASADSNYQGEAVPPHCADVVVVARSNGVVRRFRYVLRRGLAFRGAMAANRRIIFGEDVELKSITSLRDNQSVETRFHANDYDDDGTGVVWNGSGNFQVGDGCEVSSVSDVEPAIVSLNPDKASQDVPAIPVPALDIARLVSDANGHPAPGPLPPPTPPMLAPVPAPQGIVCNDSRYLASTTTINGDVSLYDGSLYVNGDLTINGGVIGYGSIYATGDVTIRGGNASVITNQPNGAAILSGGDITFEALDASGYIDALAAGDATLDLAWTRFQNAYRVLSEVTDPGNVAYSPPGDYDTVFPPPPTGPPPTRPFNPYFGINYCQGGPLLRADHIHWAAFALGRGNDTFDAAPLPQESLSIPSPDGNHFSGWTSSSYSRSVRDAVLNVAGSDPRAQQVSRALEHVAYYFRHNYWGAPANLWDDNTLPPDHGFAYSIDRHLWMVRSLGASPGNGSPSPVPGFTQEQMAEGVEDYFAHHDPLDFSWLGRSYFQGLLYARGNITIVNRAEVIGTVISGGDLSVADGANFTYNKEYDELTQDLAGPVRVTSFREL